MNAPGEPSYLLVETQSPFDGPASADFVDSAFELARSGRTVSLWLLQNGVLGLLAHAETWRERLAETPRLRMYADAFSLAQRSVDPQHLAAAGAEAADMPELVSRLMSAHCKVLWH